MSQYAVDVTEVEVEDAISVSLEAVSEKDHQHPSEYLILEKYSVYSVYFELNYDD